MLKIRITGLAQASNMLKKLYRGGVTLANKEAAFEVSKHIRDAVQQRYVMGPHAPHKTGTRQAYEQGKYGYAGHHPWNLKRRRRPGARPYTRSGQLANSVVITPIRKGYRVQINPNARYGGAGDPGDRGMPLWHIAARLEYPRPVAIPLTLRMLAYLKVLERGTAGKRGSTRRARLPDVRLGKTVSVRPSARPVWKWIYKKIQRFRGPYWNALRQRLSYRIGAPGAKGTAQLSAAYGRRDIIK